MQIKIKAFTSGVMQRNRLPQIMIWVQLFLFSIILLPSVFCVVVPDNVDGTNSWNYTALDRLRLQLFTNYDKNAHPITHGQVTNITLGLSVNYIDIDEMMGKMTLHAWLYLSWVDENRSWNSQEYENIKQIHLRPNSVWQPQISLFNSANDDTGNHVGETGTVLTHDGNFIWVPPVLYTAYCALNLMKWPYDEQVCRLKVGSWTQTHIEPYVKRSTGALDYTDALTYTEWEITNGSVEFITKDYYNYMEFTFNLKRRSSMYTAVIYTPAACIILLSLATFWLPPQMGEKIMLNGVVIVIVSAFLMYFAQLLPILATDTPLIVLFYSSTLMLLSISTIISVIVLYLSTAHHKRRVPDFFKSLLNGTLGSILLLKDFALESEPNFLATYNTSKELTENIYDNPDSENLADPLHINPNPVSRSVQFDWILLATALDRIFFFLYCLIFIAFAIIYEV